MQVSRKGFVGPQGPFGAGLLSLLFYSALVLVPVLGVFAGFFSPLPLVLQAASGRASFPAWGWVLAVISGVSLALPSSFAGLFAAGYLLVAVWPAVTVEWWQRRAWSAGRWLAILTLGCWLFASGVAVALAGGGPVGAFWSQQAATWVEANQQAARFWTLGSPELMTSAARLGGYLLPALAACYVMSVGLWLRPRLELLKATINLQPFTKYASEEWLPFGFVVGGLGWALAPGTWGWLAANLLATVLALYFVHGVAIILSYLGPKLGSNRWVRAAVVVFGVQLPLAFLYAGLGLLDSFVTLRRSSEDGESSL